MNKLDLRHKQAIQLYLKEYFQLFFPELVPSMRFDKAKFLDKELIGLFRKKKDIKRYADTLILIETELNGQEEWILIHWEQQSNREADFAKRMFRYFCGFYFKYGKLIFPIAMFTDPARWREPIPKTFQLSLQNYPIVEYRYQLIKLKQYTAAEFEKQHADNPLMWAYLPLTDYKPEERPRIMAKAIRGVVSSVKEPENQATLFSLIDRSVNLNTEEQQEFEKILAEEQEFEEVRMLQSIEEVFIEKGLERGLEQGLVKGLEKGIEQGLEKGKILGQLENIHGFLKNGVGWDVIEKATGITQTEYERLRAQYPF